MLKLMSKTGAILVFLSLKFTIVIDCAASGGSITLKLFQITSQQNGIERSLIHEKEARTSQIQKMYKMCVLECCTKKSNWKNERHVTQKCRLKPS